MLFHFEAIRAALLSNQFNGVEFYRDGKCVKKSFAQLYADVIATFDLLSVKSLKPGGRVGLLGGNSYEWMIADLACLAGCWVSVAFHNNAAETNVPTLFEEYSLQLLITSEQYQREISPKNNTVTF